LRAIRTLLTLMLAANVLALAEAALVRVLRQNVTGLDLPGHPVVPAALRRLGVVVLAGGAAAEIVRVLSAVALPHLAGVDGTLPLSGFGLWWLPMGLVVLAFAQVIDHGCALRAELDQVV
jgi:hypothetical protein